MYSDLQYTTRPPSQTSGRTWLAVLATLGGLLFAPLLGFALRARAQTHGKSRAIDRWDVIGAGLSMGMLLLLVERMGAFERLPFVLWWLAALGCALLLLCLAAAASRLARPAVAVAQQSRLAFRVANGRRGDHWRDRGVAASGMRQRRLTSTPLPLIAGAEAP
jgi:hypothetical protein